MRDNVGDMDRGIRVVPACATGMGLTNTISTIPAPRLALFSRIFVLDGNARWFGFLGVIRRGTALFSFCPLYTVFGFS